MSSLAIENLLESGHGYKAVTDGHRGFIAKHKVTLSEQLKGQDCSGKMPRI